MKSLAELSITPATMVDILYEDALQLLQGLIAAEPVSCRQADTVKLIKEFMQDCGLAAHVQGTTVWSLNHFYDAAKPTILLYAHHKATGASVSDESAGLRLIDGELWGAGSNDGGGSLVALLAAFRYYYHKKNLPYNLCFMAGAESEATAPGLLSVLPAELPNFSFAIAGEPTKMQMAIAEMGHLVLDCVSAGRAGHAGRDEGDNAIYHALRDINWFSSYQFNKCPAFMPPIRMAVSQVNAGNSNNMVPAECRFSVDVYYNTCYSVDEILATIVLNTRCRISLRDDIGKPTELSRVHPFVLAGLSIGLETCVSPTGSVCGRLNIPALKIGPGDPACTRCADERIPVIAIRQAINIYIKLLERAVSCLVNKPDKAA